MRKNFYKAKSIIDGEWVFGTLVNCNAHGDGYCFPYIVTKIHPDGDSELIPVIPGTECHSTELTDKHGFTIFEKDILRSPVLEGVRYLSFVTANDFGFYECGLSKSKVLADPITSYSNPAMYLSEAEIVGNLFDTPKLFAKEGNNEP